MRLVLRTFLASLLLLVCGGALGQAGLASAAFGPRGTEVLGYPGAQVAAAYWGQTLLAVGFENRKVVRLRPDGSVDRRFGGDGKVEIAAEDIAVTADRKILILGAPERLEADPTLTRLLPNGRPDRSFGGDGVITVDLGYRYDTGTTLMVDAKGRMVIGGFSAERIEPRGNSVGGGTMVRLLPGGAVDRSFGSDGRLVLAGGEDGVADLAPGPRGSIFVLSGGTSAFMVRLRAGGGVDLSFGEEGIVSLGRLAEQVGVDYFGSVPSIGVAPGGKIVLAGTDSDPLDDRLRYRVVALRLRPDGSLDPRYGEGGLAAARLGSWFFAAAMLLRPSGHLVVAGSSQRPPGKHSVMAAIGFDPDGKLDRSFGRDGKLRIDFGKTWGSSEAIVAHPGGRATIVGYAAGKERSGLALARIKLSSPERH